MTNLLTKFLIKCSGANESLLAKCPNDINRLASIGATILFTGIFASISGGYAFFHVFFVGKEDISNSYILTFVFALFWGFMIFNLDRFIVLSMRKKDSFLKELPIALPRIFLAFIIALIVSRPLEIRIFQDRLHARIVQTHQKTIDEVEKRKLSNPELKDLESKISSLEVRINTASEKLSEGCNSTQCRGLQNDLNENERLIETLYRRRRDVNNEIASIKNDMANKLGIQANEELGLNQQGQNLYQNAINRKRAFSKQIGRLSNSIEEIRNTLSNLNGTILETTQNELLITRTDLTNLRNRRDTLISNLEKEYSKNVKDINKSFTYNLVTLNEALEEMKKWKNDIKDEEGNIIEKANNSMFKLGWGIFILFLLIECAPVCVKLMSKKSQYDYALEANDTLTEAKLVYESNYLMEMRHYDEDFLENTHLESQSCKLQLFDKILSQWKSNMEKKIEGINGNDEIEQTIAEIMDFRSRKKL